MTITKSLKKVKISNIDGRLPEKLQKNRLACRMIEIETETIKSWKSYQRLLKSYVKKLTDKLKKPVKTHGAEAFSLGNPYYTYEFLWP